MKKRAFVAVASIAGLLAAGACAKKDNTAADTAGTATMADTGMGAAGVSPGSTTTPTISDTAASGAAVTDTTKGRYSQDTTTKK